MARLFGLIGNRADLAGRVLALEADPLRVKAQRGASGKDAGKDLGPLGWGVGFYQSGEVLMRRRPIDDRAEIDVAKNCADVRADVMIGHVRMATVGALRTENPIHFDIGSGSSPKPGPSPRSIRSVKGWSPAFPNFYAATFVARPTRRSSSTFSCRSCTTPVA